jgi:Concanavalin A-like lectin/glucanases superfamily
VTNLHGPTAPTSVTPGAIVGEELSLPRAGISLAAGQILRTNDLGPFETPDVGGLGEFTIEVWMKADSLSPSGGSDYVMAGPGTGGSGTTRQWDIKLATGGILSFTVRDMAPAANTATSSVAIITNTWYHVVGALQGGNVRIYINGTQAGSTAWPVSLIESNAFIPGTADFFLGDGSGAGSVAFTFDELAVYRHGLSAARILEHYHAGTQRGYTSSLTGDRIKAVLDTVASQAPRQIGTGARTVGPAYMSGQSPLESIRSATKAEAVDAVLFTDRSGGIVFLDSAHRSSSPYDTVQATFDDDGTDLPYADITLDYSESFLSNEWSVTRAGFDAVTQTVSDTTSTAKYYKRPQSITGIPVTTDGQALTIATALLAKYKDPMTRVTSITLTSDTPAVAEAIFRRDIGDRIRVFRTPPGGGARIDQTLFIQKIEITATPYSPWQVKWAVSPL